LLLTDVVMPILGGRALVERFRAQWPESRVLFMSGYTGDNVAPADGVEPGAFIQKPFTPLALARQVRALLDKPAGPLAAAEPRATILVVDDDPEARESLAELLRASGYSVITAPDGERALEYLGAHPSPSLILLDLDMPGMNGWVFRTEQQRDPALAGIPIVVLSGVHDPAGATGYLEAAGHITKPVDGERLLAVVREHCDKPQAPVEASRG
jgi:CheY-like chemotaxis protein